MLAILNPRVIALMALIAAALVAAGCKSAPPPVTQPISTPPPAAQASEPVAEDLTATEAAVAALNEAPVAETSAPTAQLIRPDAPMNYTVKRGDTLWDIAAVFLKDPWFWPEIWQINPQVENPHLIYPGDVLSLAYGANGDASVRISQYSGARLQPRLRSEALDGPVENIPFSAIAAFLTRPSVLTKEQALAAPHILAFRDQHMIGGTGHEAYVRNLNAPVDQRFLVMHVGDPIRDIDSNDILGYQAAYVATAVVETTAEISKTKLTDGAREALAGDRLIIEEGERSLNFQPHAPATAVDGQIIAVADGAEQVGPYQVVVLNRGAEAGLTQGAVLAVDQQGELIVDKSRHYPWKKEAFPDEVRLPYERAGTLIVFKVYEKISYGLVIGARAPMRVADRVYNP
ncbi:MAG TPA: LysM peptidoglycan-binding domain-containing protein [Steroidobacteraceae bacterium]